MPAFAKLLLALDRAAAGLRQRSIQIGDHRILYAEGGRGETVLLLHGFGADQGSWTRMARFLTKRYHVIAPDLPGWGASTRLDGASYAYPAQVDRVHRFVQEMKLGRFHLMGHSMGGAIAAFYAASYPGEVMTLGLMAPHGIVEPRESGLRRAAAHGENWLVVSSPQDFERLMQHLFVKRPYVPRAVLKLLEQDAVRKSPRNGKIFGDLQRNDPPLAALLPKIQAPVLLIWGEQDEIIDVSAAEIFKNKIADPKLLLLPNSGHMPLTDHAREAAHAYLEFLREPARRHTDVQQQPAAAVTA